MKIHKRDTSVTVIAVISIVVVGLLVLPPLWILARSSVAQMHPDLSMGGFTLANFGKLFGDKHLFVSALNSTLFAIFAMMISLLFGGMLAWLVERTDTPLKPLAYFTTIVSFGTPYILYVTAWLFLLGRTGPFNDAFQWLSGSTGVFVKVNSLAGMVFIEGFLWSPLAFLLLSSTFRAANAEMEEAAQMSGASVFDTIRLVSLKLAWPAIAALMLFVFIRNLEAFEVPALVGMPGGVSLITTEIYNSLQKMPPDTGYASAFSVILIVIVSAMLYFYSKITRKAERYASVTGKGYRPRPFRLGKLRWLGAAIVLVNFAIVLVLPLIAILWMAVTPFIRPMRLANLSQLTMKHFVEVLTSPYYGKLAFNTIVVSTSVATAAMLIALFAGWLAARNKRGGRLLDQLMTIPLVFPGIVLGLAVLEFALALPISIYGTLWILMFGFLIRYMPYGMRYSYAGILQIHPELEQAAGVAGAGTLEIIRKIVVPLVLPALAAGWIFIFLIASKEMSMPLLLAGANSQTIAVAMFNLWSNGQSGEVAALGLLWTLLMTVISAIFYYFSRRTPSAGFGR